MRASSGAAPASACAWRAPAAAKRRCAPLRLRLRLTLTLRSPSSASPPPLCLAPSLRPIPPLARRRLVSLVVCALPPPPPGDPGAAGPAVSAVDAAARDVVVVSSAAARGARAGAADERVWLSPDLQARVYLLLVPFLWGTYGPALRFIYSQPHAPSASIITLSRKCMCPGPSNTLSGFLYSIRSAKVDFANMPLISASFPWLQCTGRLICPISF